MMKKYLSMLLFVIVMGAVSTGVLMGADYITKDAIARNAEFVWKSAILTHHEIAHTQNDFVELFDSSFQVETEDTGTEVLTLYTNVETGRLSFRFKGMGLWDSIEGVITFEQDFKTIVGITVTKQAETPGLGGVVAEKAYLDKFVGKEFSENLEIKIIKGGTTENYEVDAITGATGTSNAFANLLTANYREYVYAFSEMDPNAVWKKAMLSHHNVEYTSANYVTLFDETFDSKSKESNSNYLTLYTNKTTGAVSFLFETGGLNGPITGVLSLQSDFVTILNVTVLSNSEVQGAVVAEREILDSLIGKKFPGIVFVATPSADNEAYDGFAAATTTKSKFAEGLNAAQALFYNVFFLDQEVPEEPEEPEVDPTMAWKQVMLSNNGVDSTEADFATLFSSNFYEWVEGDLTYYVHKTNHSYNFTFEGQGKWGPIKSVLTLETDFVTIKKVVVYEQTEQWGAKIQTNPAILAALTGVKLSTPIQAFDGMAGSTETMDGFLVSLNETYANYYEALVLNPMKKAMLANNNIAFTDANFESLFDSSFEIETSNGLVLYTTKSTGALNILVDSEGKWSSIKSVLTLETDFETIKKVTVYSQNEKTGAKIETTPEILAALSGLKFEPTIEPFDGMTGATQTMTGFLAGLNTTYAAYFEEFGGNE